MANIIVNTQQAFTGVPLTVTGTAIPLDALNRTITWNMVDDGDTEADLVATNPYVLTAAAPGYVVLEATIIDGIAPGDDFVKDFTIEVRRVPQTTPPTVVEPPVPPQRPGLTSPPFIPGPPELPYDDNEYPVDEDDEYPVDDDGQYPVDEYGEYPYQPEQTPSDETTAETWQNDNADLMLSTYGDGYTGDGGHPGGGPNLYAPTQAAQTL